MIKKEKQTYPRPRKEMLRIMKAADKRGHLAETIVEEFVRHPFSMPALWDCREYFYRLDTQECMENPVLVTHLALIYSMAGRLDLAKESMKLLGETPKHWQPQDLKQTDLYRIILEMVMPYTSDSMFLRIIFCLIKMQAVPVMGLTLSACRPSILNGFRDFTRYGPFLERYGDIIIDTVQQLYGGNGQSIYDILLAEWYYQNNKCFNALVLVTGIIPLVEKDKDMRCLFVALALQMKILLVNLHRCFPIALMEWTFDKAGPVWLRKSAPT